MVTVGVVLALLMLAASVALIVCGIVWRERRDGRPALSYALRDDDPAIPDADEPVVNIPLTNVARHDGEAFALRDVAVRRGRIDRLGFARFELWAYGVRVARGLFPAHDIDAEVTAVRVLVSRYRDSRPTIKDRIEARMAFLGEDGPEWIFPTGV